MPNENEALLFLRIAGQKGLLQPVQQESALKAWRDGGGVQPIGSILVLRNVLTPLQVQDIVGTIRTLDPRAAAALLRPPAAPPTPPSTPAPVPAQPLPDLPPLASMPPLAGPPTPVSTPAPAPVSVAAAPANAPLPAVRGAAPPTPQIQVPPAVRMAALLEAAERKGASDVHLHTGCPVALRVEGKLGVVNQSIEPREQERMLLDILSESQRKLFEESGDLDFAYVTPAGLRTRANLYRTNTGIDGTFRLLRRDPQSLEALGMPAAVAKLVSFHQGLALVTGPAGSGKSTTLAALVDLLNGEHAEHILSLEDPIEIVHPAKKALVNQRQIARDTESFARALRGALREDPDVIVIGELRDRETISLAITAAETGHLVIGSMQTNSAARTIARLIDAFPPVQQGQVRAMLSESLRGVVTQRLVPGVDGKRIPAVELLLVTPALGNLIREGKLFQIKSAMQTGKSLGMRSMDDSLRELVVTGKVAPDVAKKLAESPAMIPNTAAPPPPDPAAAPVPGVPNVPNGPNQPARAPGSTVAMPRPAGLPNAPAAGPARPGTPEKTNPPARPLAIPRPGGKP